MIDLDRCESFWTKRADWPAGRVVAFEELLVDPVSGRYLRPLWTIDLETRKTDLWWPYRYGHFPRPKP